MTKMIAPKDLAEAWGIGRSTVYDLMNRKNDPLPSYDVGGVRIDPREAEAWRKRQKRGAAA